MKVTNEKTESSQTFLTIEMETTEVEESLEKAYYRLVRKANIPGFRRGKAPRAILERYLGRERLLEEALDTLLPEAYEKAIEEQGIEAIARPQIELTQTEPLVFKAIVPLKPKVKLGDYQHIQVTPPPVEEVTEDNISAVLEQLRHRHATWEPVARPIDYGDLISLDVWSNIENRPFINQKGAQYQVVRNSSLPLAGFADQLIGMKKDEVKEFKLQLPADYPTSDLAGKEASFKVRVDEIKQEILPELSDDFAGQVNPDFKTLDSLREKAASDLKLRAEEKVRLEFEEQVIDATVGVAEVEFPPVLLEAEINQILSQRFRNNQELEVYLKSVNKTGEELREEIRPLASNRISRSLVLGKVAEEEKIEVSDTEVDSEISNMTDSAIENKEELRKILDTPQGRDSIKSRLLTRKTIQRLVDIAQGSKTIQEEEEKK